MLQSLNSIIWPCLIVRHGRHDRHDRSWFDRAPFTSKAGTVVPVRAYSDSRPQPCVPVRATVPGFPSGRHDRSGTWHDRVNHWIFLGDTTFNVEMMISNSAKSCS